MAEQTPNSPAADAPASTLGVILHRLRRHPLQSGMILLAALVSIFVLPLGVSYLSVEPEAESPSLATALKLLEDGDLPAARELAASLRRDRSIPFEAQGGPLYILGVSMARDAASQLNATERKKIFLIAARYLEEARERGFPEGHDAQGLYLLGKSLYETGRYPASLPVLQEALTSKSRFRKEILWLLAAAHMRDSVPALDKAEQFNAGYLDEPQLDDRERSLGYLQAAEIHLRQGQVAASRASLDQVVPQAGLAAESAVLQGRVLIYEADQLLAGDPESQAAAQRAEAAAKYTAALQLLRGAPSKVSGISSTAPQAQYLVGVCYRRLGDLGAAETQFSRTRRLNYNQPEGIAAGIEEAEIQRLVGKDALALASYRHVMRTAAETEPFANPWITQKQLQDRVIAAYEDYREQAKFDRAIELTRLMPPLVEESQAVLLRAEAQREWADELNRQAEPAMLAEARSLQVEARRHERAAARQYEKLAELRVATRSYPDDIWQAAQGYLRGREYRQAIVLLKRYLNSQPREARPRALVALGEANLASGKLKHSLKYLKQCIEFYPRHPDSYRARLTAARAHLELGELDRARQLLVDNLENESLTPASIDWRRSKFMLGRLLYREGIELEAKSRQQGVDSREPEVRKVGLKLLEQSSRSFRDAIEELHEAVERFPEDADAILARYWMAESYRQAAKLPRKRLPVVTIETIRGGLNRQIQEDLGEAVASYLQLIQTLNAQADEGRMTEVQASVLRNCYFAHADCLYDLGRLEAAVRAYSAAANSYPGEPATLEALVQIANCNRRLNRLADARGALEHAKVVFEKLKTQKLDFRQTTRYDQNGWQQLLDWLATI